MAALSVNGSAQSGSAAKRFRHTGRSARTGVRVAVSTAVGLCALLTGCSVTAPGHPSAAPDLGRWQPPLIQNSRLSGLLLSVDDVNSIGHTSGMAVRGPVTEMSRSEGLDSDVNCVDAHAPLQEAVYQGSNWQAVQGQVLDDAPTPDAPIHHLLVQAVVAFGDVDAAQHFFGQAKQHWSACSNRPVTVSRPDHPPVTWNNGALVATDTTLTMVNTVENSDGEACQRAIGLANNVIIDTAWCGTDISNQGNQVVNKITDSISQV